MAQVYELQTYGYLSIEQLITSKDHCIPSQTILPIMISYFDNIKWHNYMNFKHGDIIQYIIANPKITRKIELINYFGFHIWYLVY